MRLALYNALSCAGCDLIFFLEDLPEAFWNDLEIVFWPEVCENREEILSHLPRGSLEVAFVCGAIRTKDQERLVLSLRERARKLVAVGSCALYGGIPGLLWEKEEEGPRPVTEIVSCEVAVPGCPPEPKTLKASLEALWEEKSLEETSPRPVCDECPRLRRPFRINQLVRFWGEDFSQGDCFLSLGVICAGPVTKSGCEAACLKAGYPCWGCYGPLDRQAGERLLSALASGVLPAKADEFLENLVDPVGTLFRFFLAQSPLVRLRKNLEDEKDSA